MSAAICVVVPAADEEATIGSCLESILLAAGHAAADGIDTDVVVVLDDCHDRTDEVVRRYPAVTRVESTCRNVGAARALGAAHALRGLGADTVLASTDADSLVPLDWLTGLTRLCATADLVLGTVVPDVGLAGDVEREWYLRHDLREGHPHVHGANLAMGAGAYRQLGGWSPLATGEDVDLAARAVAAGLRVRRTAQLPVLTSTRAAGRTPHGFSSYLRDLGHREAAS